MDRSETINSILRLNLYLTLIKLNKECCKSRQKITQDFLTLKIKEALSNKIDELILDNK